MNQGMPGNRLAEEKSPYLLQHRDNPVHWLPWGDAAFDAAAELDRPVFLSIGYATCHWCHVMAHESFEDDAVAKLLNDHFVSIKVDREERPDVDHVYMTACQMMTGAGGWPLTIIMAPDKKPFFAGTYLPRTARYGRMGMLELLPEVARLWRDERVRLLSAAEQTHQALDGAMRGEPGAQPTTDDIERAATDLAARYDRRHGGFGDRNKFPTPHNLTLLLRHHHRTGNEESLTMATRTLDAMWRGGMYDHLESGFHRYSTDPEWRLPHFEKMLYDQALLIPAYLEAWQLTGRPAYRQVAEDVFSYLQHRLTSPEGGLYSAEDADSEGEEGRFYLWDFAELEAGLSPDELALASRCFGVLPEGNFSDPVHPEAPPRNVLHLPRSEGQESEPGRAVRALHERLSALRSGRPRPALDDKVLTDWNGLAIAALAVGARTTRNPAWLEAAERAARFISEKLVDESGRLLHRYRDGEAAIGGHLDDYAFLALGTLELYQAGFDPHWLAWTRQLVDTMLTRFGGDPGGLYLSASDCTDLAVRPREHYDGALPSGNSVAAEVLVKLARLTGEVSYDEAAGELLAGFAHLVARQASACARALQATDFLAGPGREIVLALPGRKVDGEPYLAELAGRFLPRTVVHLVTPATRSRLIALVPYLQAMEPIDGKPTVYVCRDFACHRPVHTPREMVALLTADS